MPAVLVIIIVAFVAAYLALRALMHAASAHLGLLIGAGALVAAAIIAITLALIRGATHHTKIYYQPGARPAPRELPSPAEPAAIGPPKTASDPFSSGGAKWAELVAAAEREEALRKGSALPLAEFPLCEGPDCEEPLIEEPWILRVSAGKDAWEHRFCSEECMDEWQHQDEAARHASAR